MGHCAAELSRLSPQRRCRRNGCASCRAATTRSCTGPTDRGCTCRGSCRADSSSCRSSTGSSARAGTYCCGRIARNFRRRSGGTLAENHPRPRPHAAARAGTGRPGAGGIRPSRSCHRPDIVLWDQSSSADEMAALYRSASAFVLPSRGEGWGRPYMEAMACGLPTIGTRYLGSADFMTDENSFLVDASLVPVPERPRRKSRPTAATAGTSRTSWACGRRCGRCLRTRGRRSANRAAKAAEICRRGSAWRAGRDADRGGTCAAEAERLQPPQLPAAVLGQIRVVLEGEFFAPTALPTSTNSWHWSCAEDARLALSLARFSNQPIFDDQSATCLAACGPTSAAARQRTAGHDPSRLPAQLGTRATRAAGSTSSPGSSAICRRTGSSRFSSGSMNAGSRRST